MSDGPPFLSPPQMAYGWFVEQPPPRGPYFHPLINPTTKAPMVSTDVQPPVSGSSASAVASQEFDYKKPPQVAYGWWAPKPPVKGPYLWLALPPGYTLISLKHWEEVSDLASENSKPSGVSTVAGIDATAAKQSSAPAPMNLATVEAAAKEASIAKINTEFVTAAVEIANSEDGSAETLMALAKASDNGSDPNASSTQGPGKRRRTS